MPSLLPVPAEVHLGHEVAPMARRLAVTLQGPHATGGDDHARIGAGVRALATQMNEDGARSAPPQCDATPTLKTLTIHWKSPGEQPQRVGEDESYDLEVTRTAIALRAATPLGVLRGLVTLGQWIELQDGQPVARLGHVHDAPRFVWRGVLLDSARHFMPVPLIKQQLAAMTATKFNVLHWHLTDDQAFRLQSSTYPLLHQLGSEDGSYSHQDVRDVVAFARLRGIRVVPEIDMPGHTESWLLGYPHLGSAAAPATLSHQWGVFDAAFNPAREETYAFIDALLAEVGELFDDPYIHIGGDEVTGKQWQNSPEIRAFMAEKNLTSSYALQTYFVGRVAALAASHGKMVVGWDEILQPGLPEGTVIQAWRGAEVLHDTLRAGYGAILSSGYYLGGSAQDHYGNDPGASFGAELPSGLLGGEVCQWSELVSPQLLNASLWPRAAAVAERLWSASHVNDGADLYARLNVMSNRLAELGVDPAGPQKALLAALLHGRDVAPYVTLAKVLETKRENWWPGFTGRLPLNGFADALYPESAEGREIRVLARLAVADELPHDARLAARTKLAAALNEVASAARAVATDSAEDDSLESAHALAVLSLATAQVGTEALDALAANRCPSAAWKEAAKATLLQQEDKTHGAWLAFAPAVALLVESACP